MGPYSAAPYMEDCPSSMQVASNWDPCMLRDICSIRPSPRSVAPLRNQFPLIRPQPSANDICGSESRESCKLPPIYNSPNPHYSRPQCDPCPQPCTPAICIERVPPVKIEHNYEPPSQPFEGCSLYRTNYSGCFGPPASSYKPPSSFDNYSREPMSGTSLYREHYNCKPLCPIERPKNKEEYTPSCTPFEGCSTYRLDFRGCGGRPAELQKPPSNWEYSSGKMDGVSSYRTDYLPYCPADAKYARGQLTKPQETSHMSCVPMSECSTYRTDYPAKCARKQPSMKPADRYGFSSAPFSSCTSYRNDFIPFYFKECCPSQCVRRCR